MLSKVNGLGLLGLDAFAVSVEIDVGAGLPRFDIVGLPDASVKESKERVRTAIKNSGKRFPEGRVTVNLAPADIKKEVANLPFIKDLAEKFDTFVVCHKPSFIDNLKKYSSVLEVFWADYSKGQVQNEVVIGYSKKSKTDAVENMIHNLSIKEFSSFKF